MNQKNKCLKLRCFWKPTNLVIHLLYHTIYLTLIINYFVVEPVVVIVMLKSVRSSVMVRSIVAVYGP